MPAFGGMTPYPRRIGGGRPPVQSVLEGLTSDRGTAYDATNRETIVYTENMALARAIAYGWSTNQRVANLWTPMACNMDTLKRWETILSLSPGPEITDYDRRVAVAEHLTRFGRASTEPTIESILTEKIGDAFVAVEHISLANAVITVPDGSYPFGAPSTAAPWSSTVAHILVRLTLPSGWTEEEFDRAAGKVVTILDPILPSWVTLDWYRASDTPIDVTGGPSGGGFFLDTEHNLNEQTFDV